MIRGLTLTATEYVLHHLRESDDREFRATIYTGDIERDAAAIHRSPGARWQVDLPDGTPAIIGGVTPVWEGVVLVWLWGTEATAQVGWQVTKFVTKIILPMLDQKGVHRVECRALAGNDKTLRWLHLIGFHQEAVIAQFGQGREDFILLARTPHARPPDAQIPFPPRHAPGCQADAAQLRFGFLQ